MSSRSRRKARRLRLALRAYTQCYRCPGVLGLCIDLAVRQRAVLRRNGPPRTVGLIMTRDGVEYRRV